MQRTGGEVGFEPEGDAYRFRTGGEGTRWVLVGRGQGLEGMRDGAPEFPPRRALRGWTKPRKKRTGGGGRGLQEGS